MKSGWSFFLTCVLAVVFASAKARGGEGAKAGLDITWTGEYSKDSSFCTYVGSEESCSNSFRDTLKVRKNSSGYFVELYSTQADQHVCSLAFQMAVKGGALEYDSKFGLVLIEKKYDLLKVSSGGVDPTALGLGVCGAHADIDGLEFPISSRVAGH
ncbi:hypothetical protein HBO15_05950 [Pseudomonas sp. WS 5111]|jgi:hypothetical protein|uniref:hypothetical protein n=1 Tax=unclassified Pseudomonas TaxID=196821 RepID=UPI001472AFD1|nr:MULTISPECIES: hypothetical protein [unclassified Pseudomonas]NMX66888.1 hypothetical protein [Pseudomonas sp. WS 5111]NMX84952.1 hypothetical protein [Pseudomonas sp. WS 5010]